MPLESDAAATIAEEIVRYLTGHPKAADSAEGIRQWWLSARGGHYSIQQVEAALECLLDRRLVQRELMPDGRTLYGRVSPEDSEL